MAAEQLKGIKIGGFGIELLLITRKTGFQMNLVLSFEDISAVNA